jgi:hypothetical protein
MTQARNRPRLRSGFLAGVFASPNFFSFSREAKFGQFRLARLLQVVCWLQVVVRRWGETQ